MPCYHCPQRCAPVNTGPNKVDTCATKLPAAVCVPMLMPDEVCSSVVIETAKRWWLFCVMQHSASLCWNSTWCFLRVWVSVVSKCFGLAITPAKANCGKEEMSPTDLLQQSHPIIAPHSNSVAFLKTDWLARWIVIFTCLWLWEPQFKPQFKN